MPSEPGTLNFPTSLDDVISLIQANNHASAALGSGINNSVLLIPVTQISEFSDSGYATILDVVPNPTVIEIVKYTSKSGSDLVVPTGGRGQQGTTASAFSAGAIVEQRHTQRHHGVLRDAIIEIEKKIGYGTPLHPLDASGTNQAGAHQDLHGGKGTGNAAPGHAALRYPLRTASGSGLQALSAERFPLNTNLYTNTGNGDLIANTTTETSLFTNAPASAGSTRTLEAGIAGLGAIYRVTLYGTYGAVSGPTGRVRAKFNTTVIADTNTFTMPNSGGGVFCISFEIHVVAVGSSGSSGVRFLKIEVSPGGGGQTPTFAYGAAGNAIDFTQALTIDVTFQWGTANASNAIQMVQANIERIR